MGSQWSACAGCVHARVRARARAFPVRRVYWGYRLCACCADGACCVVCVLRAVRARCLLRVYGVRVLNVLRVCGVWEECSCCVPGGCVLTVGSTCCACSLWRVCAVSAVCVCRVCGECAVCVQSVCVQCAVCTENVRRVCCVCAECCVYRAWRVRVERLERGRRRTGSGGPAQRLASGRPPLRVGYVGRGVITWLLPSPSPCKHVGTGR